MVCADAAGGDWARSAGSYPQRSDKGAGARSILFVRQHSSEGSLVTSRRETYQLLIGIGYQSNDKRVRDRVVRLIEDIANDIDRLVDVPSDWRIGK